MRDPRECKTIKPAEILLKKLLERLLIPGQQAFYEFSVFQINR